MTVTSTLAACFTSLVGVFTWTEFGLLLVGVLVGALVGILPGLGGAATLAMLLPFILGLDPLPAFALLIGVAAVTATTGDLTSILIGIPGEPTTTATIVDGHPMARRGEAARAIGASLFSSLAGSLVGALTLGLTVPFAAILMRSIGSPELFMLALLGITFVAPLAGSSRLKGVAAGGLGLMLATVGLDPLGATPRFTFGRLSLWDGVGVIPVALGLFAIPEIVELAATQNSPQASSSPDRGRLSDGLRDVKRLWRLVLRSSAIGAGIGLLPGIGASVSQWVAYADAARRSPHRAEFGRGAVEGVIAPSAANNATLGGALAHTLALGVPGSLTSAMLLSALVMKGLVPGPRLLAPESQGGHLTLVFALVWFMVIANVLAVALSCVTTNLLVKITRIRAERLVPFLLLLIFVGAFTERQALGDVLVMSVMGTFGLAMVRYGWPRAPVLLGLVLGPLAENRLFLSMDAYGGSWLVRPGVLIIAAIILGGFLLPEATTVRKRRPVAASTENTVEPLSYRDEPIFGFFLVLLLIGAFVAATGYTARASLMPRLVSAVTIPLLVGALALDFKNRRWPESRRSAVTSIGIPNPAIRWIPVFLLLIWGLGFLIGAPLAIFGYLFAGGERPGRAAALAAGAYMLVDVVLFRWLDVQFPAGVLFASARF